MKVGLDEKAITLMSKCRDAEVVGAITEIQAERQMYQPLKDQFLCENKFSEILLKLTKNLRMKKSCKQNQACWSDLIYFLMTEGVDVFKQDVTNGNTCIHNLVMNPHPNSHNLLQEIIDIFMQHTNNNARLLNLLNIKNEKGLTALMLCIKEKKLQKLQVNGNQQMNDTHFKRVENYNEKLTEIIENSCTCLYKGFKVCGIVLKKRIFEKVVN